MNEIKIKFNEQEFLIKQTFRSLMLFEEMTSRSANEMKETTNDLLTLFYCILKACNKETFIYSFDEFIDLLDNNQKSLANFSDYLQSEAKDLPKKKALKKV
jgi:hypothetical protein